MSAACVQVTTLFNDLHDEVRTGQYINSVGQPAASSSLNSVPSSGAWEPAASKSALHPSQPRSGSGRALAPAHAAPLPTATETRMRVTKQGLPPRPPGHPNSDGGSSAAGYSPAAAVGGGGRGGGGWPRGHPRPQQLARSHRAAVRDVLSMPFDTMPEDARAEFPPLPPFLSAQEPPPMHPGCAGAEGLGQVAVAQLRGGEGLPGATWSTSTVYDEARGSSNDGSVRVDCAPSCKGATPGAVAGDAAVEDATAAAAPVSDAAAMADAAASEATAANAAASEATAANAAASAAADAAGTTAADAAASRASGDVSAAAVVVPHVQSAPVEDAGWPSIPEFLDSPASVGMCPPASAALPADTDSGDFPQAGQHAFGTITLRLDGALEPVDLSRGLLGVPGDAWVQPPTLAAPAESPPTPQRTQARTTDTVAALDLSARDSGEAPMLSLPDI